MLRRLAVVVLAAASLTACGSGGERAAEPTVVASSVAPTSFAPSGMESTPGAPVSSPGGDAAAAGTTLKATVGTASNKDAFEIDLTKGSGTPVSELPAGTYTIEVQDYATIHNFHLTGPGVDQSTTVPFTGGATWNVTLKPGTYTYVCDPHSGTMRGTFTVT